MGLIRLLAYAMLGYVLYELFLGISEEGGGGQPQRGGEGSQSRMSGGGKGMRVEATDAGGASVPHTVGRGVIS